MIQLKISEKTEQFRQDFREWLKSNPAPRLENDSSLETFVRLGRAWQAQLAKDRWVAVHWPKEYGGRSLSLVEEAIVQEELVRAGSPQLLGLFGLSMVGPVLIEHGTDQQKQKYLSKILSAEEVWCQGFSEPGAGSDLAALRTKARVTDKGFYVTGQKIWTSFAHIAEWCFILCRTSEESSPHQGLTYLLLNMKAKGVTTRPLKQITGDEEFNEVFFDDAFVPKENVVGKIGGGWKIAISTLMYERAILTFARQLQSEVALKQIITNYRAKKGLNNRSALAFEISRACAVRALAYDHLMAIGQGAKPGPEGSMDKLLWSESFQAVSKLALNSQGAGAALGEHDPIIGADVHRYLYSRGRTIAAGTSEIQRNIIAERLLGLPRLVQSEKPS